MLHFEGSPRTRLYYGNTKINWLWHCPGIPNVKSDMSNIMLRPQSRSVWPIMPRYLLSLSDYQWDKCEGEMLTKVIWRSTHKADTVFSPHKKTLKMISIRKIRKSAQNKIQKIWIVIRISFKRFWHNDRNTRGKLMLCIFWYVEVSFLIWV